jgi:glycosyltransferase involved in cell wall biosynthesis
MKPRISVLITSYNQKTFLTEAIESVLSQTLQPFEIIIVDDCSTDGSQKIIENYTRNHPDIIKAYYHKQNLGIGKNRAFAQMQAKGDWLTYLDGDDRFLPEKLEMEFKTLQQHPDSKVVYSNFYSINEEGKRSGLWADKTPPPSGYIFSQVFSRSFPRNTLFRNELIFSDCLKKIGYYDEERITHVDWDFKIRLSKYFHIAYCPIPLIERRDHAGGISQYLSKDIMLNQMLQVYKKNSPLLEGLEPEEKKYIRSELFRLFSRRADSIINHLLDEGHKQQAFLCYREFRKWMSFEMAAVNLFKLTLPLKLLKIIRYFNKPPESFLETK